MSELNNLYWVEDVEVNGGSTRHGPVSVTVNVPSAIAIEQLGSQSNQWCWGEKGGALVGNCVHLLSAPSNRRQGWQYITYTHYTAPTGQETSLNPDSCSSGAWCCNADDSICYYHTSGQDSILEFSLTGAPSVACVLVHSDDDTPNASKGLYYATDGGNGCHINDSGCARLSKDGASGTPLTVWAAYYWLCGW